MEQLTFTIKNKQYTTKPLRVGSILDMWKMRSMISMGTYGQIYRASMESADEALLIVDIEAFFTSFVPELLVDLKPSSIQDLGIEDYMELKDIYVKTIKPWLEKVEALLKERKDV